MAISKKEKWPEEEYEKKFEKWGKGWSKKHGGFDCVYGLSFIGAAVYYVQQSSGFWAGVLGVLKALVWPAMLIYKVFTMIKM